MLQAVRPEALAARREELRDTVPLGATDRLADFVRDALEHCADELPADWERWPVAVRLDFEPRRIEGGRPVPAMTGHAAATLPVTCERCLGLMELELEADIAFLLPDEETGAEALPGFEVWATDGRGVRLLDVVEEELLLSVPLALVHEDESRCRRLARDFEADETEPETQRPFGALKALMKDEGQGG
ncbi:MAG: YceD family protein [Gammaproteobacteria bacterium]